jgi:hypothetical protein
MRDLRCATMRHLSLLACESDLIRGGGSSRAAPDGAELERELWGRLEHTLFGSARVSVPGIGPLVVMGPLVGRVQSALEGGVLGGAAGLLRATLAGIGIPDGSIVKYGLALMSGGVLVLVHGTEDVASNARAVLVANGSPPRMARGDDHLRAVGDGS